MTFVGMMKTGKIIKDLRVKKGMTQEELAEKTELSTRTIQRIENGEVAPRSYTLQVIAKALEVDFSIFVEDEATGLAENNDNIILGFLHLSGLLLLFFPTFLIWFFNKQKVKDSHRHFKDIMGFQLTMWLICILPGLAIHFFLSMNHFVNNAKYMIFIGLFLSFIFSVSNTINVMNNNPYRRFVLFRSG